MRIKELEIDNFKCFSKIRFEFGNLNLLAGSNGCGKSSVIQALLMLRQSYKQFASFSVLSTYGMYTNLGNAKDIIYETAEELRMHFQLTGETEGRLELVTEYEPEAHILKNRVMNHSGECINLFSERFEYLSAERISPQTIYSTVSLADELGNNGENTLSFLEEYGTEILVHPVFQKGEQKYLLYCVNDWLDKMFDGFRLQLSPLTEADAVSLRYRENSKLSNLHRATNVGFGITYVLPVLTALLKAKDGELIILENPEAHLHPRAQRLLGELISKVASTGPQIIVETHSDHILNGIRISVKNNDLEADKVKLFFFMRERVAEKYNVNVYAPVLAQNGDVDIWPEGFFDEWDNALAELF